jgi:hypothetical protein
VKQITLPVALGLGALAVVTGCHPAATEPQAVVKEPAAAVKQEPQLSGSWDNKLMRGMDPVTKDVQIGLSGRFVVSGLGGTEQEPLQGEVSVDVYDLKPADGATEARLLEEWLIQPEHLAAFGKQDKEGFVLTLNLPWSSYRPDITTIKLAVKFKPAQGAELKQEDTVTLDHSSVQPSSAESGK